MKHLSSFFSSLALNLLSAILYAFIGSPLLQADTIVMQETRVDQVRGEFGLTGKGTIIAILDRGIDYEHLDFINEDGSSRILYIFDMYDQTGANAPNNSYGVGTIYSQAEINAALSSGNRLNTRDAVGHGTPSAGIAGGNGRASNGLYEGVATDALFIIVKMATEGAPAHGVEPEEVAQPLADIEKAMDFVLDKATEEGKPVVLLANFGSIGGPTDGSSSFARAIDARFGPDKPGRVFVNGTGDDGGVDNHAAGSINQGESIELTFNKTAAGFLRLNLWYNDQDRFDAELIGPTGSLGSWAAPDNASRDTQTGTGFTYYHNGSQVDFFLATSPVREILIDFTGTPGTYTLKLTGASITDGSFHASLNPSNIFGQSTNTFTTFVSPGSSIWYGATALHNIAPNSYVVRQNWQDIDGLTRTFPGNEGGFGSLWTGSSIGPTYDGRLGTTVSVPGNTNIGAYGVRSYFNTLRFNVIQEGQHPYGTLGAVSGAAPVLTGIISLMLEQNPNLDAAEVKDILQKTARADNFTGTVPNPTWGYGKVDAYEAIKEVRNPTGIDEELLGIHTSIKIFPNPFQDEINFSFEVKTPSRASVSIYDTAGRKVVDLMKNSPILGTHQINWNPGDIPYGLYFVNLEIAGKRIMRKVLYQN